VFTRKAVFATFVRSPGHRQADVMRRVVLGGLVAMLLAWLTGCDSSDGSNGTSSAATAGSTKPRIVVTARPVADLVSQIVGDWADVSVAPVKGGAATMPAESFAAIDSADVVVVVGDGSDDAVRDYVRGQGAREGRELVVFRELDRAGVKIRGKPIGNEHDKNAKFEPGFPPVLPAREESWPEVSFHRPWLDMMRAQRFLGELPSRLGRFFPGREVSLRNRVRMFRANLAMVQQEYEMRLAAHREWRIAVVGDGLDTLPRGLALAVVAHPRMADGASVAAAAEAIRGAKADFVWIDAELSEATVAELSRALGDTVPIVRINTLGEPTQRAKSSYLDMMKANMVAIEKKKAEGKRN